MFDLYMPRRAVEGETRQIYASVREDIYLAAKARAAELRVPLRELIEMALARLLTDDEAEAVEAPPPNRSAGQPRPSIWNDEYIGMQARQPIGSPVELTREEAARIALGDINSPTQA